MSRILFSHKEHTWFVERTPKFSVRENEHVRIEFSNRDSYNYSIPYFEKELKQYNFKSCNLVRTSKRSIFRKISIKNFITKNTQLEQNEVSKYLEKINCNPNESIFSITDQLKTLLSLKVLVSNGFKNIFVYTAGMHVKHLTATYSLINELISEDGTCLEITYPPFESSGELIEYLERKPLTLKSYPFSSPLDQ